MQERKGIGITGMAMAAACALTGCSDLPRDPDGTADRIRAQGSLRLGMVAGAAPDPMVERRIDVVAVQLGAEVNRQTGDGEALLRALEDGKLDLVFGRFADNSPWHTHVHLGEVRGRAKQPPKDAAAPRLAYRNGENGWIMLVEGAGS